MYGHIVAVEDATAALPNIDTNGLTCTSEFVGLRCQRPVHIRRQYGVWVAVDVQHVVNGASTVPPGTRLDLAVDASTYTARSFTHAAQRAVRGCLATALILSLFLHTWRSVDAAAPKAPPEQPGSAEDSR